jgi:hypothetical protein
MVKMDLVRKSSGGIDEKFRLEKERAAWRKARSEAVKFDLKADLSGVKGSREIFLPGTSSLPPKTLKSSSSSSFSGEDRGWLSCSPGGEETGSRERRVGWRFRLLGGVCGDSNEESVSVVNELLSDGMDSIEIVLFESTDSDMLSQMDVSSDSKSSGAINRISMGPLLSFKLSSFSDSCALPMMDSSVILFSVFVCRRLRVPLGGGMLVTASRAATDAGMASRETSLERCVTEWCLRSP